VLDKVIEEIERLRRDLEHTTREKDQIAIACTDLRTQLEALRRGAIQLTASWRAFTERARDVERRTPRDEVADMSAGHIRGRIEATTKCADELDELLGERRA
jgi:predicted RNA-binding protein with PIN domain